MTGFAGTVFAVVLKHLFKLAEQVGFRTEMTEVLVAGFLRLGHRHLHVLAVEAMEGIALDKTGADLFAEENLLKGFLDRRGARTRGTGNRKYGMFSRHVRS